MASNDRWRVALVACVVVFLALVGLFWPTVYGMGYVWYHAETYTHGFIILPISIWLVWQKRHHIAAFTPQPTPWLLVVVALGLLGWMLARIAGVQVVEQLAFVGVIVTSISAVVGWQVAKFLAFPLLFLFFAVPMGEELVEPMMEFTATFTVGALKLTGIPVYREGLWFSLPTGDWSVVEACSGVRYLIASVTLGFMYAYITYHTLWKRLVFVLISAIVPIIANGLRAYMIVMIGHLSGMEYATGVDHLIYGWFFFGVVMFILFWIGAIWQEVEEPPQFVAPLKRASSSTARLAIMGIVVATIVGAGIAALTAHRAETMEVVVAGELSAPPQIGDWRLSEITTPWKPIHGPTPHLIDAAYVDGEGRRVRLHVILFPHQRQGHEAISAVNKLAERLNQYGVQGPRELVDQGESFQVNRAKVSITTRNEQTDADEAFSVYYWQWYRIAGRNLINRYEGKAWEVAARLMHGRTDGAWIALSTNSDGGSTDMDEARIEAFAESAIPKIGAEIDRVLGLNPQ